MIRRSAYTILVMALTATAAIATVFGGRVGLFLSVACAGAGVLIATVAWSAPAWRSGAGPVRHGLVTIAGVACIALVVFDIVRLLSASD